MCRDVQGAEIFSDTKKLKLKPFVCIALLFVTPIWTRAEAPVRVCPALGTIVRVLAEPRREADGEVLVREVNGRREVVKRFGRGSAFREELDQWRTLDDLFQRAGRPDVGIRWDRPTVLSDPSAPSHPGLARGAFVMPLYPGRTLHDHLIDPRVPEALKVQLRTRYRAVLQSLARMVTRAASYDEDAFVTYGAADPNHFRDRTLDSEQLLIVRVYTDYGPVNLIIKTDNIMVDPETLEFRLIDPY